MFAYRKLDQDLLQVEIGGLPSFRSIESGPNLTIATDMVGPYLVKRTRAQTRGAVVQKVWLLFTTNTYNQQVFCTGLDSQNLYDLMQGFQELFVLTGKPSCICTNAGSNLQTLTVRHKRTWLVPHLPAD